MSQSDYKSEPVDPRKVVDVLAGYVKALLLMKGGEKVNIPLSVLARSDSLSLRQVVESDNSVTISLADPPAEGPIVRIDPSAL